MTPMFVARAYLFIANPKGDLQIELMIRILSDLLDKKVVSSLRGEASRRSHVFDKIVGYDGIKRTFLRSLSSKEPVHILLIGPP
jgi:hypothetical protein